MSHRSLHEPFEASECHIRDHWVCDVELATTEKHVYGMGCSFKLAESKVARSPSLRPP